MNYVDVFVAPIPAADKEAYIEMARAISALFIDHGALRLVAAWGDDVPEGKLTSFPLAVQCQGDEVVAFSWIQWPSKAARTQGMEQARCDKRMQQITLPGDRPRIIFGSFQIVVDEQLRAAAASEQKYLDGFAAAVATTKRDAYIQSAHNFMSVFQRHGALHTVEAWGDDIKPGKLTSFPQAVQLQDDEAVVVSWVAWPTRAERNACMEAMMKDPEMQNMDMPFDGQRMIYGGFEVVVDSAAES